MAKEPCRCGALDCPRCHPMGCHAVHERESKWERDVALADYQMDHDAEEDDYDPPDDD